MTRACASGHPDHVKFTKTTTVDRVAVITYTRATRVAYMALFACSLPLVLAVEAVRAGYWRMRE